MPVFFQMLKSMQRSYK